jgi:hypothetical protein
LAIAVDRKGVPAAPTTALCPQRPSFPWPTVLSIGPQSFPLAPVLSIGHSPFHWPQSFPLATVLSIGHSPFHWPQSFPLATVLSITTTLSYLSFREPVIFFCLRTKTVAVDGEVHSRTNNYPIPWQLPYPIPQPSPICHPERSRGICGAPLGCPKFTVLQLFPLSSRLPRRAVGAKRRDLRFPSPLPQTPKIDEWPQPDERKTNQPFPAL